MGQPVVVVEKKTAKPGVVRFETNRILTGTGHRNYFSADDFRKEEDPADVLARRLFETGAVEHVHLYQNMVTVDVMKGYDTSGLKEIVEGLYSFYNED